MRRRALRGSLLAGVAWVVASLAAHAQESPRAADSGERGIALRKTVVTREFEGETIEGEERVVAPGESLWRILIDEKGLSPRRFNRYLHLVQRLNPRMGSRTTLRVGERVFIPLHVEEELGPAQKDAGRLRARPAAEPAAITEYRIRPGDYLYRILREQLGIRDERDLALYFALVKDLNPERRNWDRLLEGEVIRLPSREGTPQGGRTIAAAGGVGGTARPSVPFESESLAAPAPRSPVAPPLEPRQLPARRHLELLEEAVRAVGCVFASEGEEDLALAEGTVRLNRASFPVASHPKLGQKVILDIGDKIPPALREKLGSPAIGVPVVTLQERSTIDEAVRQVLSRLGFQLLPADRPVVLNDGGIAYEASGAWIALAPQESDRPQEIFVLTFGGSAVPDEVENGLAQKGLHLRPIGASHAAARSSGAGESPPSGPAPEIKVWPREKPLVVDALLNAYGVRFEAEQTVSAEVYDGLSFGLRADRVFQLNGRRTALLFGRAEPELKKLLQEKQAIRIVELDLGTLSVRELIARLLSELGQKVAYRENRFPASNDRRGLAVNAWGFLLPERALFLTDREIPPSLHRFFFEKGLQIVYFQ
ncbi:MAG TPA: hypothetical protein VNN77_04695 [candidate division Zixibacteria bacterium]|nr:hypothetical protein [candidate division Zixibacteria bacterium]